MIVLKQIKRLLSSRLASIIIILLSIAGRVIQKIHFTGIGGDKAYQLQATKNLLEGHGLTILEAPANDLSQAYYVPLIKWPPGYSILQAPFYALDKNGFLWGSLWLEIIFATLFVWLARKTIRLFNIPTYLVNLYTIVTGFFLYDFIMVASTDIMSLVFFQGAVYIVLKWMKNPGFKFTTALWIALLLFGSGFMRYIFIPVAFVIPLYIIASGMMNRNRLFARQGWMVLGILTLLIGALLIFQQWYGGSAIYTIEAQKGFYPENITRMNSFLFNSVINDELTMVQLESISNGDYITLTQYLRYFHLAVVAVVLIIFIQWLFRKKLKTPDLREHFMYIGTFSSLVVGALLVYLSVTNAPYVLNGFTNWSYVDEGRYYAPVVVFLQQFLFIEASRYPVLKKTGRFIVSTGLALLFLFTIHGIYYTINSSRQKGPGFFNKEDDMHTANWINMAIDDVRKIYPGKPITFAATDPMLNNYAALWKDVPGMYDFNKLEAMELYSSKETVLLVASRRVRDSRLKKALTNVTRAYVGDQYTISVIHVGPGKP